VVPKAHIPSRFLLTSGIARRLYAGAFWLLVGIPLALGSWWGLGLIVPFLPALLWRLLDEEKILNAQLRGYTEYTQRVRYRLIPFVW
jgi:protein-S-isoprenylcysteine O-methyltransferase Ste14